MSVPNNEVVCCFCSNDPLKFCAPHHRRRILIISFSFVTIYSTFDFLDYCAPRVIYKM